MPKDWGVRGISPVRLSKGTRKRRREMGTGWWKAAKARWVVRVVVKIRMREVVKVVARVEGWGVGLRRVVRRVNWVLNLDLETRNPARTKVRAEAMRSGKWLPVKGRWAMWMGRVIVIRVMMAARPKRRS